MMDAAEKMKNDFLFTAGVLVLVSSFAHLSVCQNQVERPGAISSSDCAHGQEAAGKVDAVGELVIERIVVSPGWEKTNPNVATTSGEVLKKTVVASGRPLSVMTRDTGDRGCILREDWDNTRASGH